MKPVAKKHLERDTHHAWQNIKILKREISSLQKRIKYVQNTIKKLDPNNLYYQLDILSFPTESDITEANKLLRRYNILLCYLRNRSLQTIESFPKNKNSTTYFEKLVSSLYDMFFDMKQSCSGYYGPKYSRLISPYFKMGFAEDSMIFKHKILEEDFVSWLLRSGVPEKQIKKRFPRQLPKERIDDNG